MLWIKFGKQKMKPKTPSLLMSGEQTPAALHNQDLKTTEYAISNAA